MALCNGDDSGVNKLYSKIKVEQSWVLILIIRFYI